MSLPVTAQGPPRPANHDGTQDCGAREMLPGILWRDYREVLSWQGVAPDGTLIELYLSLEGTWTIVAVNGVTACARASGADWMIPTTAFKGPET